MHSVPPGAPACEAQPPAADAGKKVRTTRTNFLGLRKGRYFFVRRYPRCLVRAGIFKRPAFRKSLGTSDRLTAEKYARRLAARFDELMARLEARMNRRQPLAAADADAVDADPSVVRDADVHMLAARFEAMLLDTDEVDRDDLSEAELETYQGEVAAEHRQLRNINARGDHLAAADVVEGFLDAEGLRCTPESATFAALCKAMVQAQLKALRGITERLDGGEVKTPEVPPLRSADDLDDLGKAFEHWVTKQKPGHKTLLEIRPVWLRLQRFTGKTRVSRLTREDVLAFQASELERARGAGRVKPQTVNKHFGLVSAIIRLAHDDLLRSRGIANPFEGLRKAKVKGTDVQDKQDLTIEELCKLFGGPVHHAGLRTTGGAEEAAFWMPILGYATGARMAELAQLQVNEVVLRDGVWCLWLTNTEEEGAQSLTMMNQEEREKLLERSLKTGQSRRVVAIHPKVIDLGFLDYVQWVRARKAARLFPAIQPDAKGSISGRFSKWFNGHLGRAGIKRKGLDWVSFRHTFKTACRTLRMDTDIQDYLQGHTQSRSSQRYGSFTTPTLHAAISSIPMPGLDAVPKWVPPVARRGSRA